MAWLGTWAKRIKITVDNTNIDSDLTQFPVPIVLGTSVGQSNQDLSAIFDELTSDANRFKIAITKADGETQIYGDIELWDDANEKAVIHVAKSDLDILTASTTTLYIYYDSTQSDNTTYISDSGGTAAQSVYDSNFTCVVHNNADPSGSAPQILDATGNNEDFTSLGTMLTEDLVDGNIGKALDFDGSNDLIQAANSLIAAIPCTVETSLSIPSIGAVEGIFTSSFSTSAGYYRGVFLYVDTSGYPYLFIGDGTDNDSSGRRSKKAGTVVSTSTKTISVSINTVTDMNIYGDGVDLAGAYSGTGGALDPGTPGGGIGAARAAGSSYFGELAIGEFRVSDIERSADWIKATHYALTDDLLTYGSEETGITLDSGTLVFAGTDIALSSSLLKITLDSGSLVFTGTDIDLDFNRKITLDSGSLVFTGTDVGLKVTRKITLGSGALALTGTAISFGIDTATIPGKVVYLFTLTGTEDGTTDVEIPVKSFQARLRSGEPTYLMIVIPGMDYATQINARSNGTLQVDLAYLVGDEYTSRETIIEANLEDIRIDQGSINKSISLTGHKQVTYSNKAITLYNPTYKNILNGLIRYRLAEPNLHLYPGDTVTIDSDTFDANVISYFVSARKTTMEVAEE